MEGHPRHTAKAAMVDGDGSLKSIMSALDQVYGGTTTYTTLLNKLNSIQQGYAEPAKDYYERVLQIRVKLQEFHAYMFRRGDLECQTKEAFFNGLKPEYQAMVVHKKDDPTVGTTDLLSAVRECFVPVSGIGGFTQALGYAIINVRIEGIGSYNEEQVVLVIEDVSGLGMRVPVILGTPTIHRLCRQLKESEFEMVPNEWQHALRCYEVAQQVPLNPISVEPDGTKYPTNTGRNPMDLDEQLILTDKVIIPAFSSQIIKVRTIKTYMIGHRLNVTMQPPYLERKRTCPLDCTSSEYTVT